MLGAVGDAARARWREIRRGGVEPDRERPIVDQADLHVRAKAPLLDSQPPPAQGFTEVFYPGEVEFNKERDRRKNGVPIEDATWSKIRDLAHGYGLADELGF